MKTLAMKLRYPIGFPMWRVLASMGMPLSVRIDVFRDAESQTYWAKSPNIDGLVVEGASLDELRAEVMSAATMLLAEELRAPRRKVETDFHVQDALCSA